MTLSAGRLRHRVEIQALGPETFDRDGRRVAPVWQTWATVWAAIEPLSARDAIVAAQTASKVIARVVIRHRDGVNATMRILHREDIYNIVGVLTDKDSGLEYITLPVTAGTNRG